MVLVPENAAGVPLWCRGEGGGEEKGVGWRCALHDTPESPGQAYPHPPSPMTHLVLVAGRAPRLAYPHPPQHRGHTWYWLLDAHHGWHTLTPPSTVGTPGTGCWTCTTAGIPSPPPAPWTHLVLVARRAPRLAVSAHVGAEDQLLSSSKGAQDTGARSCEGHGYAAGEG